MHLIINLCLINAIKIPNAGVYPSGLSHDQTTTRYMRYYHKSEQKMYLNKKKKLLSFRLILIEDILIVIFNTHSSICIELVKAELKS
jgi:hypothetical protein